MLLLRVLDEFFLQNLDEVVLIHERFRLTKFYHQFVQNVCQQQDISEIYEADKSFYTAFISLHDGNLFSVVFNKTNNLDYFQSP